MVVPMFAPMITHTAWRSVIMPEFTKPTTITVVAEEDCITAVMTAPTSTPKMGLDVRRFQNAFHSVARRGLQAGAHHLHSIQEEPQAAQQHQ